MSDIKISALPAAGALTGAERVVLNQGGVTKTAAASSLIGGGTSGIPVFNVMDYGALGDNSHDDTTAIQAAITAAAGTGVNGGIVYLPGGNYRMTGVTLPSGGFYRGVSLQGESCFTTTLNYVGPTSDGTDPFNRACAIKILGNTQYRSGNFTVRNQAGSLGTTVGILHSGTANTGGTVTGQCTWDEIVVDGFLHGMEVGDVNNSASELLFLHPVLTNNTVGVYPNGQNSITIIFVLPELVANGVGIQDGQAQSIHVFGGSTSGNTVAAFSFGLTSAPFILAGVRSENEYFLTARSSSGTITGCSCAQSVRTLNTPLVDLRDGRYTFQECSFDGAIYVGDSGYVRLSGVEVCADAAFKLIGSNYAFGAYPVVATPHDLNVFQYDLDGVALIDASFARTTLPCERGIGKTATFYGLSHLVTGNGIQRWTEVDANPSAAELTSGANAKDKLAAYMKADKLVFAYNNAGTVTYLSIPLDGSSTVWTHGTSAP
jgi:hypothetical protein